MALAKITGELVNATGLNQSQVVDLILLDDFWDVAKEKGS